MSLRMNKFIGSLGLVDAANSDLVSAATGVNVYVLRAGATAYVASTISTSVPALTDSKGALAVNDTVKVLKSDGTLSTETFTIGSITETRTASTDTVTYIIAFSSVSGGTSTSLGQGERLVLSPHTTAGNLQPIYNSGTEAVGSLISQPLQSDNEGNYEFYCNTDSVDLYFSGTSITDGYWVTDLKIAPKHERESHLKRQTEAAASSITLEPDTGVLEINSTGTNLSTIAGAMPGRVLIITGVGATAVNVATTTSVTADRVVVASTAPNPIVVPAAGVLALVGAVSGGTNYWKAQRISGVSLGELNNISLSTLTSGEPLVWNGTNWVNSTTIGTTGDPLTEAVVVSLKCVDGTGDVATVTFNGTANRAIALPDAAGTLLIDSGTHTVTGEITVDDDALILRDPAATTKKARLDCGSITAGNTRVLTVQDKNYTIADDADVPAELNDLSDFTKGSPTDGQVVVWDNGNSDFRPSSTIGNSGSGLGLTVNATEIKFQWPGGYQSLLSEGVHSNNQTFSFPSNSSSQVNTLLVGESSGQVVSGVITFDDDGLFLRDPSSTTKLARFDAGAITAGNTRVVSLADRDMSLDAQSAVRSASVTLQLKASTASAGDAIVLDLLTLTGIANGIPLLKPTQDIQLTRVIVDAINVSALGTPAGTLQIYNAASLPTTATVPPTGTAMLTTATNLAIIGSTARTVLTDTTSFVSATVSAGNFLFLGVASAVTGTTGSTRLHVIVEYKVTA